MKTKKVNYIAGLVVTFVLATSVNAQQEPLYTQYMFNQMSVNPAYTGTREALNVFMLSRMQWVGMEGAPRSLALSAHTPYLEKKIGLGASLVYDKIGPVSNTFFNLNYAHRIKINAKLTLSLGLKAGFNNYSIGLTDLNTDEGMDPAFTSDIKKRFQPNMGAGAYLYSDKYFAGIAVPKLFNTSLDNIEDAEQVLGKLKQHYFINGGYIFNISSELIFRPSGMLKMVAGAPPSFDITAHFLYRQRYWGGVSYRIGDAISFLLNMKVNQQFMIGYSYDITMSGLSNASSGSHEIFLSYDFVGLGNNKVKSPRYF